MTLQEIEQHTINDRVIQCVAESLKSNKWDIQLKPYFTIWDQLSLNNNILLKDNQITVPAILKNKVLKIAHQQHQLQPGVVYKSVAYNKNVSTM